MKTLFVLLDKEIRQFFRNAFLLSDRLFFASFPNLLLIFKFCLFHIIFLGKSNHFPLQI